MLSLGWAQTETSSAKPVEFKAFHEKDLIRACV